MFRKSWPTLILNIASHKTINSKKKFHTKKSNYRYLPMKQEIWDIDMYTFIHNVQQSYKLHLTNTTNPHLHCTPVQVLWSPRGHTWGAREGPDRSGCQTHCSPLHWTPPYHRDLLVKSETLLDNRPNSHKLDHFNMMSNRKHLNYQSKTCKHIIFKSDMHWTAGK